MPDSVGAQGRPAEPHRSRRSRRVSRKKYRRRRRIVWAIVITALAILLAGAWVGFRLWQAYGHLQAAAQSVHALSQQLKDGHTAGAKADLAELQQHATAAQSAAHDFLWSAAEHVPGLGPNLSAVRAIADSIDALSWQTLPPLVELSADLDPSKIAPKNGAIDLAPLIEAKPDVDRAISAIDSLHALIGGIDTAKLIPQLAGAVGQLDAKLEQVRGMAATAQKAVTLLPPMLGADGPRTYLVVFQNLAELRATGGIYGAYAIITADHGEIEMVKQGATSGDIPKFDTPVTLLPPEQSALYTERPAMWAMDVNMSPDFPTGARLIRDMYRETSGVAVDGVIATDPVALSEVLDGTGPVALSNGDALSAESVVKYLLADAYARADDPADINKVSDQIFADAAKATFAALVSGQGSPSKVLKGLQSAAAQHRLLVWSDVEAEQDLLATTVLGGTLPEADGGTPLVGVYLNDGTGGKMDYYLNEKVSLISSGCRSDGRAVLRANISLTSTAPSSGLPDYVTGLAMGGDYVTRTNVMVFSPTGGQIESAKADGEPVFLAGGTERGRNVGILTVDLKPGESTDITVTIVSGELPPEGLTGIDLRTTPMATPVHTTVGVPVACHPAKP
jgi:cell division protein FtsB